jgi:predicted CXXCH cytochrome family protein
MYVIVLLLFIPAPAFSEEIDCLLCHENLTKGTSVHQAVSFGCTVCHSGIDATDIPHTITNRYSKGLSSRQNGLCYNCHDKSQFMKNTVHGAVLFLGCTSCHNPHSSENERLLYEPIPALCKRCHEESKMARSELHGSIGDTSCSICHNPHASDSPMLLISEGVTEKQLMAKE